MAEEDLRTRPQVLGTWYKALSLSSLMMTIMSECHILITSSACAHFHVYINTNTDLHNTKHKLKTTVKLKSLNYFIFQFKESLLFLNLYNLLCMSVYVFICTQMRIHADKHVFTYTRLHMILIFF